MAKKAIIEKGTQGLVSWSAYESNNFGVNDRLNSLVFDVSSAEAAESTTITIDGSDVAFIKALSTGFVNSDAKLRSNRLRLNGVDATTIYGGAVLSTAADLQKAAKTTNFSVTSRYINAAVDVEGGSDITLKNVTATTVYGGGAGYGSTLVGDVNLVFNSTNRIGTVYGGGQKGAVVTGDVNMLIERTDAQEGGRISAIYGGGDNATVLGDVNITVRGANAVSIGTISGSGKGTKGRVEGYRTLTIDDYSGKFTATIKNFDLIQFTGSSAVTLTQGQNSTIKSAEYEFVIDEAAFGQSSDAMLTWSNSSVNTGNFYITVDVDDDYVANGFADKKIYYSSYLTARSAANISVRALNEDGTYSDIDDSAYTLAFVADKDSKGDDKAKGGYVTLTYTGSKVSVTADTLEDVVLTSAADRVNVKGDIVDVSVDTGAGNDRVSVQSGTQMRGDIYLGKGTNVLNVQANAQVTGSVVVDANSKNTINLNGAVSQIEGGDATTENIVNINNDEAVGFYRGAFFQQDLTFANDSADTVVVSTASNYTGNINFGKGKDTLVLNTTVTGTITSDDGNDIIVANKSGVNIDTTNLRLTGTDNALVVANGVRADITGVALGNFANLESDTFSKGVYLGQNAIIGTGNAIAVSSFNGDFNLAGTMTVLAKDQLDATADSELIARIGNYYTAGKGVNGTIQANGQNIVLKDGAAISGKVINGAIRAEGNVSGGLEFEGATINVTAEDATMTVSSIAGLDVAADTTLGTKDYFEADLGRIINLANDAKVVATADDLTVAGPITGATTFDTKNVAFIRAVKDTAKVTLKDQNAYFAATANVNGAEFSFEGTDALEIKGGIWLDNKKLTFAEGAKVTADVLEDGVFGIRGIANGETSKIAAADVTLGKNAEFVLGNTTETADWNRAFENADVNSGEIVFRDGAQIVKGINVTAATDLTLGNGSLVKNDNANAAIQVGGAVQNLTIGESDVYGAIVSTGAVDIALNKTTVKGIDGTPAAVLTAGGTLVADNAAIDGDITGGTVVELKNNTVLTGNLAAAGLLTNDEGAKIDNSTIWGELTGEATVTGESVITTIGHAATAAGGYGDGAAATVLLDGANVGIDEIVGPNVQLGIINGATVNGATKNLAGVEITSAQSTVNVVDSTVAAITQIGNNDTDNDGNADTFSAVTISTDRANGQFLNANSATIGNIVQKAAEGTYNDGTDITLRRAAVTVGRQINQTYTNPEAATAFPEANDPVTGNLAFTTGDVTQAADWNTFQGGVFVQADGTYDTVAGDANPAKHKPAVVTLEAVNAAYGAITQTGDRNAAAAEISYFADGESDVTVSGASTLAIDAITQASTLTGAVGVVNLVDIQLNAIAGATDSDVVAGTAGAQSNLTLGGDITATVGAISQLAYDNNNVVTLNTRRYSEKASADAELAAGNITAAQMAGKSYGAIVGNAAVAMTVNAEQDDQGNYGTAIEMLSYKGDNTVNLNAFGANGAALTPANDHFFGQITVNGDIKVGGVITVDEAAQLTGTENAAWGDRVSQNNSLTADAGTVTVNGNVSLIGINNTLVINNSSDQSVTFANNVYVAGNNNNLTVGTGVSMDNIHFYDLKDYDKFGQEEYEIGLPTYTNTLRVEGKITEIFVQQKTSNDDVEVIGGVVEKGITTQNSKYVDTTDTGDIVNVEAVEATKPGDTVVAGRNAQVGGDIKMGLKDVANDGENTLTVTGKKVSFDDVDYVNTATVGGSVEMYSDRKNDVTLNSGTIAGSVAMTSLENTATLVNNSTIGAVTQTANADKDAADGQLRNQFIGYSTSLTGKDTIGGITQVADVAEEKETDPVKTANNSITLGYADVTGAISQTADGINGLGIYGSVDQAGSGTEEDPYLEPVVSHSTVTGDITQTSTMAHTAGTWSNTNYLELEETDVKGNISQLGQDRNYLYVEGYGTYDVGFVHGDTTLPDNGKDTFEKAYPLSVEGSIAQNGLNNSAELWATSVTGAVTQNAKLINELWIQSDSADAKENFGVAAADCEFNAGQPQHYAQHGTDKDHQMVTIQSQGAFNAQTVGDVVQTVSLPEQKLLDEAVAGYWDTENYLEIDNVNVGAVEQTHAFGENYVEIDNVSVTKMGEYVGEIDMTGKNVTKVATYDVENILTAKSLTQNGFSNEADLTGVKTGALVQNGISGKDKTGAFNYADNMISVNGASDTVQVIVDVATWDDTNKEVFTKTVLKVDGEYTKNERLVSEVDSITQINDQAKSYGTTPYGNMSRLSDTNVKGDVKQELTGADAYGYNVLDVQSSTEHFTVLAKDGAEVKAGGTVVDYDRLTKTSVGGSVSQKGYSNQTYLGFTDVKGAVTQVSDGVKRYDTYGVAREQFAWGNEFSVNDGATTNVNAAVSEIGLEKEEIYTVVSGNLSQTLNNAVADSSLSTNNTISGKNTVAAKYAKFDGGITQTATNGDNRVTLNESTASFITQANTTTELKYTYGGSTHTANFYSKVELQDSSVGTITTGKANDVLTASGDSEIGSVSMGEGTDFIDLYGKTKVTGTIDMGAGVDQIDINETGTGIDLSGATLKNVNHIEVYYAGSNYKLEVKAIETDDLYLDSDIGKLAVKTLVVGDLDCGSGMKIGDYDNVGTDAINLTFKKGLDSNVVLSGSKDTSKTDTVTFGDDITTNITAWDFETVTFQNQAQATAGTKWGDSTTGNVGTIKFTGIDFDGGTTFALGTFTGYSEKKTLDGVTLDIGGKSYKYNGTDGFTLGGTAGTTGDTYYKYNAGVLTTATIA